MLEAVSPPTLGHALGLVKSLMSVHFSGSITA
jgi:hypothetical protein